jgi:hypothetical protein
MYARGGKSDDLCGALFNSYGDWIFKTLDGMPEFASDLEHNCALVAWDKYDDKNKLMGYTAGRFMKPDAPVPEDMDYIDISEGFVIKSFFKNGDGDVFHDAYQLARDETNRRGEYHAATWIWSAEVFSGKDLIGVYIHGIPK